MKKSIILFGKGPSVLKCTKQIVNQHDEIAICNYPVLTNFFYNLIQNRTINYHFANCGTIDERYTNEVNKNLNIQKIFNTNTGENNYKKYLKNKALFQNDDLYNDIYINYFKHKYNTKPSSGIMMFKYLLDTKKYNKITLVGFDGFKLGEKTYYYDMKYINKNLQYLIETGVYNNKGEILIKNEHPLIETRTFIEDCINENDNINFTLITNMKFNKQYTNLIII